MTAFTSRLLPSQNTCSIADKLPAEWAQNFRPFPSISRHLICALGGHESPRKLQGFRRAGKHNLSFAQFRHALRATRKNPANGRAEGIQVNDIDAGLQS